MTIFWIGLSIVLIGAVLTGLAATVARYRREIRAARERVNRLNSQVIETSCGPMEYLRMGEGYPVLVVHGALGGFDHGLWLAQQAGLNIPSLQVISVSRFGHLRSPVPAGANLDFASRCLCLPFECPRDPAGSHFRRLGGLYFGNQVCCPLPGPRLGDHPSLPRRPARNTHAAQVCIRYFVAQ